LRTLKNAYGTALRSETGWGRDGHGTKKLCSLYRSVILLLFFLKEDLNDSAETGEKVSQTPLDTFPDIDNYRNILSLTGEAKSRPTLPELQVKIVILCTLNSIDP
jgi:hypothetical protein